jgi:hypothetical protein
LCSCTRDLVPPHVYSTTDYLHPAYLTLNSIAKPFSKDDSRHKFTLSRARQKTPARKTHPPHCQHTINKEVTFVSRLRQTPCTYPRLQLHPCWTYPRKRRTLGKNCAGSQTPNKHTYPTNHQALNAPRAAPKIRRSIVATYHTLLVPLDL